jgi:hypothetical protein
MSGDWSIDLTAFKIMNLWIPLIHCFLVLKDGQGKDIAQYHWFATDTKLDPLFKNRFLKQYPDSPTSNFELPANLRTRVKRHTDPKKISIK